MSTLKLIFDFLLSVVKVFFPRKKNGKHPSPDPSLPDGDSPRGPLPEGDGNGDGGDGGDTDPLEPQPAETTCTASPPSAPSATRLMGWALITGAIGKLLFS